jgi:chemotaxis protein methyltransferase CheR
MAFSQDDDTVLSEEEFRLLRDFIHEKFGIYFDTGDRALLRSRLLGRLSSLDLVSFEDYYHYLRFGPERNEELWRMITHLTNNETYFYREAGQLNAFADNVLRLLKDRKLKQGERRLRIVSAGCSTGEEAHTLSMMLHDSGEFFWNWDLQIYGIDVDQVALEKARKATYHHNSFRSVGPEIIERHFVSQGNGSHQVKEALRKQVQFVHGNIIESSTYEPLRPIDVIICRNVLIYFSDTATLKAIQTFHQMLAPGGYLLLGHAESLSRISDMFTPIRFKGAMIYQKPESSPAP